MSIILRLMIFFFQAEDGIRDVAVTGVQTCALPIYSSVHFGRRCEEESRTFRLREAEGLMGGERSHLQRLDGQFQVVDRDRGTREVEHALEWPLHLDEVGHVVQDQLEVRVALQMVEVRSVPGDEVVHPDHPVAQREQPVAEMRTEESSGTRYEDAHATGRPMLS